MIIPYGICSGFVMEVALIDNMFWFLLSSVYTAKVLSASQVGLSAWRLEPHKKPGAADTDRADGPN